MTRGEIIDKLEKLTEHIDSDIKIWNFNSAFVELMTYYRNKLQEVIDKMQP